MEKTKKELQAEYKERKTVGGIIAIKNTLTGKMLLESTADLQWSINRFEFSKKSGTCVSMKLKNDWTPPESPPFTIEILEKLEKGDSQTDAEYKSDLSLLMEMWLERSVGADLYA